MRHDRHRRLLPVLLFLLFAVPACENEVGPPEDVPVSSIWQDGFSGFDTQQRLVIRTQNEWQDAWRTLWRRTSEPPPLPAINFTDEVVVIVANGTKPTSGYSVAIESVSVTSRTTTVTVRSVSPGSNCVTLQVLTSPVAAARVPRRDEVTFVEQADVRSCG